MYVGVTYTGNGPYRSEVPAVSSRSLDTNSLFQVELFLWTIPIIIRYFCLKYIHLKIFLLIYVKLPKLYLKKVQRFSEHRAIEVTKKDHNVNIE